MDIVQEVTDVPPEMSMEMLVEAKKEKKKKKKSRVTSGGWSKQREARIVTCNAVHVCG